MVTLKINIGRITVSKCKCDTPVPCYYYAPSSLATTFQFIKIEAGKNQFRNIIGGVNRTQAPGEFLSKLRQHSAMIAIFKQPLQPFMLEGFLSSPELDAV